VFSDNKQEAHMKAVLLGYGTVGKGVETLCANVKDLELKNVFVLPQFEDLPYFTNDGIGCVTDPEVDIVFECLSGTEPSNTLITEALKHGKHVITSNKATVSPNLERYIDLANEYGGSIQIEASVAGGIPFLDAILKLSLLEDIKGYEGIFNGTSNYILDQMQKNGLDFDTALKQAQAKGYAELDPKNDVEGWDVFYKSNITNMLAYKTKNDKLRDPLGISRISTGDIEMAKANQKVIRHISHSIQKDNEFATIIAPVFLDEGNYLASVADNYNAQLIYADSFDQLGYFGQGAGRMATAQAMLANALDTIQTTERKISLENEKKINEDILQENWLVRSAKDLSALAPEKSEAAGDQSYYWFNNRTAKLIDEVFDLDDQAMIALWR
jgi:homoserine dehydrogenase